MTSPFCLRLAAVSLSLLIACSASPQKPALPAPGPLPPKAAVTAAAVPAADPPGIHVLMINGGGSPAINYQSHLVHLKSLRDLLVRAGVRSDHISILASDGSSPAPDLATREAEPEADFWRVAGTRLERALGTPTTLIDSKLPGAKLEPATKANVALWFDDAAQRLHAGDSVILYVTDHGTRRSPDPLDNQIMLWGDGGNGGNGASLSVRELSAMVAKLPPGVRVVSLMSQCFSGGFANLAFARLEGGEPSGDACGYFSSTADRRAYGCYAENRGKDSIGHSFEFVRALAGTGTFPAAHDAALSLDTTPDVPLRTTDTYLEFLVRRDANAHGAPFEAQADTFLHAAFADPGAWQKEAQLLDRIAQGGGSFSPRSLGELDDSVKRLPENDGQLTTVSRAWQEALSDANTSNVEQFLATHSSWVERLSEPSLASLDAAGIRALSAQLLPDLAEFTKSDAPLAKRIEALKTRGEEAAAASYRIQVRLAVVLRLRTVLLSIAGRRYLQERGTPAEKAAFEKLSRCEDLSFPSLVTASSSSVASATPEPPEPAAPHPSSDQEMKLTESALPGWMGISFKEPTEDARVKQHLSRGASLVSLVFPDSAAAAGGFQVGDIVLGPPGTPFTSRNQIRQWTMLSEIGTAAKLEVLRNGQRKRLSITPRPYPMKWPALPGPMQVGADAPKVDLHGYRGAVAANARKSSRHLLYFWATWCGPCKAALPELLAFEKERKVPIVAVTDEEPRVLDTFFQNFSAPFPKSVGVDELRRAFVAYGVSGTPTFVLVDEKGKVAAYQVGYDPTVGLTLPGWTWSARPNSP